MGLSDEQVQEYQRIHKEVFKTEISKQDAYDQGIKLVRFLSVILKPMTEAEFINIKNHIKEAINSKLYHN
jgi:hypothetical protein